MTDAQLGMIRCAKAGLSQTETARALGVSQAYVCRFARDAGIRFVGAYRRRAKAVPVPGGAQPRDMAATSRRLFAIMHPKWSPADDLLLLQARAAGDWFAAIAVDMDRGVVEVEQRWHRLRVVPDIAALIEAHIEAGAEGDAPWPDPSKVAA